MVKIILRLLPFFSFLFLFQPSCKNCSPWFKVTMGIVKRFEVNALLFVGLALLSCGAKGARRGLVNNVATVFDVTKHGAIADAQTDCAMVGFYSRLSIQFLFFVFVFCGAKLVEKKI